MAVRQTIQIGDPLLVASNAQIVDFSSEKTRQVIQDLVDTMHEEGLIGMAAPQMGENYQIFVTEPRETDTRPKEQADELRVYINPSIISVSDETITLYEGCGSVLHGQLFGPVIRPKVVVIQAYDQHGKQFQFTADGILGRVIQHEYDHLVGVEFVEKISDYTKLMAKEHYIRLIKENQKLREDAIITIKEYKDLSATG